jgi:hypothetical protein
MDQSTRTDLVILAAALAGLATIAGVRALREDAAVDASAPLLVLPSLVAAASLTRRAGRMANWYPERVALLGATAFAAGVGLGLFAGPLRALLPKVG